MGYSVKMGSWTSEGKGLFYDCPIENATIPTSAIFYVKNSKLKLKALLQVVHLQMQALVKRFLISNQVEKTVLLNIQLVL